MSLANNLTISRMLLIPVFVTLLLHRRLEWALAVFLLAALTDALDGFIARRTQVTALGRFLDPMADKLLLVSAYVVLPLIDGMPFWVSAVVVLRDVVISVGFLITYLIWGAAKISVRPLGKITTVVQILGVGLYLLGNLLGNYHQVLTYCFYCVALITVVSGTDYVVYGIRRAREFSRRRKKLQAAQN